MTFSTSFSPTTGDMTIDEVSPILTCPGDPYPATASNCTRFDRAPVDVHRTITMDHLGRMTRITDAFTSRDGAAHTVDLQYEQDFRDTAPADPAYLFPWRESTFTQHTLGDTFPGPGGSAPGSILVKAQKASPDGDPKYPQGAITYSAPPDRISFLNFDATKPNRYWALDYKRTVPASGALTLAFAYSQASLSGDVATLARDAETALAPTSAGGGRPLPGGPAGSGTGGGGGSGGGGGGGSGSGGSTFRGVSLGSHRLSVSKGRLSLKLACPRRAVGGCRGTATLYSKTSSKGNGKGKQRTAPVVYGKARFTIAVHRTRSVRLKLTRAGRKALSAKHGRLSAVLNVQARDRARTPHTATTSTTVKLVAKKARQALAPPPRVRRAPGRGAARRPGPPGPRVDRVRRALPWLVLAAATAGRRARAEPGRRPVGVALRGARCWGSPSRWRGPAASPSPGGPSAARRPSSASCWAPTCSPRRCGRSGTTGWRWRSSARARSA